MGIFEHKKIIADINRIDTMPDLPSSYSEWILAKNHLEYLRKNALSDELIIYTSSDFFYTHSVIVENSKLFPIDKNDLLKWSLNPFNTIASYVYGGGRDDVWIERGSTNVGSTSLNGVLQLVFARTFNGWSDYDRNYVEIHQEYTQLSEIHWRPEKRAYCRYNEHGDLESVISITTKQKKDDNITLVSFMWEPLEEYLVASDSSLIRLFDFTLFDDKTFTGWANEHSPIEFLNSDDLFYRQSVIPNNAAYTVGVQIITPRNSKEVVYSRIKGIPVDKSDKNYVEYIAYDWRNNVITKISTDPNFTSNYFNANEKFLPFELSPAFFKPDVLLKYKSDREKYTVNDGTITCRSGWELRGIDVNEAGQVHTYICDLRRLPYEEQIYWLSFNEYPKASISKRAFENDFEGKWSISIDPHQDVLSIIHQWNDNKITWWTLRDEKQLLRINPPITESRDEWAESFLDLSKLIIEGFESKVIRSELQKSNINYEKEDRTITLLEKLVRGKDKNYENIELTGLRSVQFLRTKLKGHIGGSDAKNLVLDAQMQHETFYNHFQYICSQIVKDLNSIENIFQYRI